MNSGIFQLTQIQQYLVNHYRAPDNESWCYHTQFSYHLHIRNLNPALFHKAVQQVQNRHPVLRTVFCFDNGRLSGQRIEPSLPLPINYSDCSKLDADKQAAAIAEIALNDRSNPFDILNSSLPLCRTYIVKRGPEDLQFMLVVHHAIWDGWSLAVFMRELCAFYQELKTNPTGSLQLAEYDYPDFITAESTVLHSAPASAFWKEQMKAFRPHTLVPVEPEESYSRYLPVERVVSKEQAETLLLVQRTKRVTLKALFLWAFFRILHNTNTNLTTIGLIMNGRSMSLKNPLTTLGLLWNIVPICILAQADKQMLLKQVNELLARVNAYGSYPLTAILNDSDAADKLPAVFNFINFEGAKVLESDADISFTEVGGLDKFHFPLHLLVGKNPFNKDFRLVLNYDTRFYRKAGAEALLDNYLEELSSICGSMNETGLE